jgi:phosphoglycerol transferase
VYVSVVGAVLVVGVFDQTTKAQIPPYDVIEADWRADAAFFRTVEQELPDGAKVVQLPYEPFPEPPPGSLNYGYEPAKAYLHSRDLRWSYGAMRGREDWAAANASKPAPELVAAARNAGFAAILLDRLPYGAQAPTVEAEFQRLLGRPPTVSSNMRWAFFRL